MHRTSSKATSKQRNRTVSKRLTSKSTNRKKTTVSNDKKSHIVRVFIETLNLVKLYHWKTKSYAQHKATDELYEHLNEKIDKFVEVLLGKSESRIHMVSQRIHLMDQNLKTFKEKIYEFRAFLVDMDQYFGTKQDTDLLSIRDEILADINQFLYLLTFYK
jgi:hypothetical protein